MNIKDFKELLKQEIGRYSPYDKCIEVVEEGGEGTNTGYEHRYKIKLYTDNHIYSIHATESSIKGYSRNYLGCVVSTRKPRAGEDWNRGNDLADGDLSIETWNKIKNDIISYELVKLSPKQEQLVDCPIVTTKENPNKVEEVYPACLD